MVCTYYNQTKTRGRRSDRFTYDGPIDTTPYSLENALGMVELELPNTQGRYALRDLEQGARLDIALSLTKPSEKAGSKRTRGEEVLAAVARQKRQEYRPEDLGLPPASKHARKPPTQRVRS